MSLLEDIFFRDEADEAKELERIIEGDDYDEKPEARSDSDDNSGKEGEAEEEKKRVDPSSTKTKRAVKNPRFILNPARLSGPRGIQVIPDHFKDFKFKGKGHEKEDLDLVLKKLEHWAYRLYPRFQFEDCLRKIETLGKKRPVMVHLHKIRSDQYISEETIVQKDSSDDESAPIEREEDEFDKLLQQQIDLARSTPAPGSVKKNPLESSAIDRSLTAPKATSSPSISEEQRERMMRCRKLAEERRLARLKNNSTVSINSTLSNNKENNVTADTYEVSTGNMQLERINETNVIINIDTDNVTVTKKHNRSNIIDSSDDEDGVISVNEPVSVDIHADISNHSDSTVASVGNVTPFDASHNALCDASNGVNDFDSILNVVSEKVDDSNVTNKNEDIVEMQNLDKPDRESENLQNTGCNITTVPLNREHNNYNMTNEDNMETQLIENKHLNDEEALNGNQENTRCIENKIEDEANLGAKSKATEEIVDLEQSGVIESEIELNENAGAIEKVTEFTDDVQDTETTKEAAKTKEFIANESVTKCNEKEEINANDDVIKDLDDDFMDVDFSEEF